MGTIELVLLLIAYLLLIIAAVFMAIAAGDLVNVSGFDSDNRLQEAHNYLGWSAFVAWIGVLVMTIIIGYNLYAGKMTHESTIYSLIFVLLFLIVSGILSSVGSYNISSSSNYSQAVQNQSYRNSIIASVLTLAGGGLVLIAFVYSVFKGPNAIVAVIPVGLSETSTTASTTTASTTTTPTQTKEKIH